MIEIVILAGLAAIVGLIAAALTLAAWGSVAASCRFSRRAALRGLRSLRTS